jgi:hypothetical protein
MRRRIAIGLVGGFAVAAVVLTASVSRIFPLGRSDGRGAIVLVSGRDDHGLLVDPQVALYPEPEGGKPGGGIADGHMARVLEVRGTWLRLESLDQPTVDGWVDDFFLRDRAVLDGRVQVHLLDARTTGGVVQVRVQPVADPAATPTWVPASRLAEVLAPVTE